MGLFKRTSTDVDRWVVVGLGNPGEKYAQTRHNAGAMVVHVLAERAGERFKTHKTGCMIAETSVGDQKVVLARPMSYMNELGRPVRKLVDFYKVSPDRVIAVHDELDIPFGEVRIKVGGGTAGHNGLRSLANHLASKDFIRVRVGISRPRNDAVDHVLERFSSVERRELETILAEAADAVERIVEVGADRAMTEINAR